MSIILNGRGSSAQFDADGVHITYSDRKVDIPLSAIREVRNAEPRVAEVLLTDGSMHRMAGGNRVTTTAFITALTAALPEERDPEARARITSSPRERALYWLMALGVLVVLAYLGDLVWTGSRHGVEGVLIVIVGTVPLIAGIVMPVSGVLEVVRRVVLSRRGITVPAVAVGKEGKKTVYQYRDADGGAHKYVCKRKLQRIQLAYDPQGSVGAAHADWLPFVVVRVVWNVVGGLFWLWLGAVMVFALALK
ncbi:MULTISPECIES: hypothetical protein [unclassified Streptomyces]|uniref:hypothetical protein n=1 Tax=unclassified Streptomyces TaxID=2593676 RepID=UPI003424BCFA